MAVSITNMGSSRIIGQLLRGTSQDLGRNLQRLSSGLRVNSSADSASAVSVSMRLTTQLNGLAVAKTNAGSGVSIAQVADSALAETVDALQSIRDLALNASMGTNSANDRTAMNNEIKSLISEIGRIAGETAYLGQNLLDGEFNAAVRVTADLGAPITLTIAGASLEHLELGVSGSVLNVSTAGTASATEATSRAILAVDAALDSVAAIRATLGGAQGRFESAISIVDGTSLAYESARSAIMDVDVADETVDMARNSILQKAGVALLAQANMQPQLLLKLLESNSR